MLDRRSASLLGPLEARLCFAGSLGRNWEVVAGIWARNYCLQRLEEGIASVAEEVERIAFGLGCRRLRCSSCLRLHYGLPSWDGVRNTRFRWAREEIIVYVFYEFAQLKAANQ